MPTLVLDYVGAEHSTYAGPSGYGEYTWRVRKIPFIDDWIQGELLNAHIQALIEKGAAPLKILGYRTDRGEEWEITTKVWCFRRDWSTTGYGVQVSPIIIVALLQALPAIIAVIVAAVLFFYVINKAEAQSWNVGGGINNLLLIAMLAAGAAFIGGAAKFVSALKEPDWSKRRR